ncbi:MAG: hypothetical protein AAFY82_04000, partial [Pseudomonadota bacterium]
ILRTFFPVIKFGGIYFVTRYRDVKYVREHDHKFEAPYGPEMNRLTGGAGFLLGMGRGPDYDLQFDWIMRGTQGLPAAFLPTDVDAIVKPQADRVAQQLIDDAAGEFDVIEDYLNRIAVETCCHHYGLEPEDPNAFAQWLMSLSALLFADYNGGDTVRTLAMAGAKRIHPVTSQAIQITRFCLDDPNAAVQQHGQAYCDWIKDTVIGRLVAQQKASTNGRPNDDDIRGMIMGLAVGFVPTGAGGGGGILEVLLKEPGAMRRAKAAARSGDDATLEAILLEAMRFKPPILPGLPRYVVPNPESRESDGKNRRINKIPAGAAILAASYSAMFDGRKFGGSIKRFDETRDLGQDDLSFGGASLLHYCIGEQIFRAMITRSFKHLLSLEDLKPAAGEAGKMERTGPFPVHMKMHFKPAAGERQQTMLTICVPLEGPDDAVLINQWLEKLGNPASGPARLALMNSPRLHFAQMTAIADLKRNIPANLLVELNGDGSAEAMISSFVEQLWNVDPFQDVMSQALGLVRVTQKKVIAGLVANHYPLDISPFASSKETAMGLNFCGLPEQSVPLIEQERDAADTARTHLNGFLKQSMSASPAARDAVAYIRRQIKHAGGGRAAAALVRPVQKDPAVSRRPTLELNETLGLYLQDRGFQIAVFGGIALFWLAYFAFLQGGFPKVFDGAALGNFAVNILHICTAFLVAYGLNWVRAKVFGGRTDRGRLTLWAAVTGLLYLIVTPIGIWGPSAIGFDPSPDYWGRIYALGALAWKLALSVVFGLLLWAAVIMAILIYFRGLLQASETGSPPEDTDLELKKYQEIMSRENQPDHAQNHIVFVTPLKDNPSWLRRVTMFIGFYFIKTLVLYRFRFGFVLDLGTIHFARWYILPKSHTMVFYSNYDGSGESYFEDFVTKARWGQTGVWSNGKGFPKTVDLLFEGAKDATRFKRWIRHHQQVTRFWFARFKDLSTRDIRRNAMICEGLAKAKTDSEYRALIDLLTTQKRPSAALETNEIQSLILRGLGNLKVSEMIAVKFPDAASGGNQKLSDWLADLSGTSDAPKFGLATFDTRKDKDEDLAINLALSPSGLARLRLAEVHHVHKDLPSNAFASLPAAFKSGMVSPDRQQILGDTNHAAWDWGAAPEPDAVLMIYAKDQTKLTAAITSEIDALTQAGFHVLKRVVTPHMQYPAKEPFGFVDGVSQPVIKGTSASLADHNQLHVVEPGEIVLGYKDNTEYFPSSPMVNALAPGARHLPSLPEHELDAFPAFGTVPGHAPRDLGKNGSFLVIRQLEQDTDGFDTHLEQKAADARRDYGLSYITSDWLGAKLMGRWRNGSSLVANPEKENSAAGFNPTKDDNAFRLGSEDPQGHQCPYGAHIRRANPRDSQNPGQDSQIELSNRHRLLRRGRVYKDETAGTTGLLFMCLNANLERQFEFVQQTWLNATRFHGLNAEYDSIAGEAAQQPNKFTIPTPSGPIEINDLQSFVTVKGGGYFFMPSRSALRFLSELVVS